MFNDLKIVDPLSIEKALEDMKEYWTITRN